MRNYLIRAAVALEATAAAALANASRIGLFDPPSAASTAAGSPIAATVAQATGNRHIRRPLGAPAAINSLGSRATLVIARAAYAPFTFNLNFALARVAATVATVQEMVVSS